MHLHFEILSNNYLQGMTNTSYLAALEIDSFTSLEASSWHAYWKQCGQVVRALRLWFAGPRFKPSTQLLTGFVLGYPKFNSLALLSK